MVQKSCDHQLRLAVYQFIPFNFEVLYIQTVVGLGISGPSTFSFSRCLPKPAGEWPQGVLQFDFFVSKAKGSPHMADRTSTGTSDSCFGSSSVLTTLSAAVPRRVATCFPSVVHYLGLPVPRVDGESARGTGQLGDSWPARAHPLAGDTGDRNHRDAWVSHIFPGFNIVRLWRLTGGYLKRSLEMLARHPPQGRHLLCYFQVQTFEAPDLWKARTTEISAEYRHAELARSPVRQFALFLHTVSGTCIRVDACHVVRAASRRVVFFGFCAWQREQASKSCKDRGLQKNRQAKRVKSIRLVVDLHEPFFVRAGHAPSNGRHELGPSVIWRPQNTLVEEGEGRLVGMQCPPAPRLGPMQDPPLPASFELPPQWTSFHFHPYLGKIPVLTNIFKWVGSTTNQQIMK